MSDLDAMTREATTWIAARRKEFDRQGMVEAVGFADVLLADDERVAAGESSEIPIGARSFVESRRLPAERVKRLKDPEYRGRLAAKEQQRQMQMRSARKRAEALLSDPANVEALAQLLEAQREAEANAKKLKVAV